MEYRTVAINDGVIWKSGLTNKSAAFETSAGLTADGIVSWVEDQDGNIIYDMNADEIMEREG